MFTLALNTNNAAFGEHWADRDLEIARILRATAERLEKATCDEYGVPLALRDLNGNTIGHALIGVTD